MITLGKSLQSREPGDAVGWYLEGTGGERLASGNNAPLTQAIEALQRAVTLDPTHSRYHLQLGRAFQKERKFDNAIVELKETIRMDPGDAGAHYALARAYKQVGDTKLAAQEFRLVSGMKAKSAHDVYLSMLTATQHSRQELAARRQR
jgi:predicted Zn-dependent protease